MRVINVGVGKSRIWWLGGSSSSSSSSCIHMHCLTCVAACFGGALQLR